MNVFERFETKYLISRDMALAMKKFLNTRNISVDKYGLSTIQSLYFDTFNDLLVLRSLEHTLYKEKLRLRCYGKANDSSKLYLEIKKKSLGIVYKRRIETNYKDYQDFINFYLYYDGQIGNELNYFRDYYKTLRPKILMLYEREAFVDPNSDLRITFDYDIRYRAYDLKPSSNINGKKLVGDYVLMEIKTAYSYPLWLARFLSDNKIYKTSFSKYGYAYLEQNRNVERNEVLWKTSLSPSLVMA